MLIPINLPSGSSIKGYNIDDPTLNNRCVLIESDSAREILTNHFLISTPLISRSRNAVKDCIDFFFEMQNKSFKLSQMVDVVPLSGSLTYDVSSAFYELFNYPLQRVFIGIRRYQKPSGVWDTKVSYTNFEGLSDETNLIFVGDTIATGATITQIIRLVQAELQVPCIFVIISIAGSLFGARRLVQEENLLQNTFPETEIWCLFTEAYLGLEPNGTDMPVFHPDTISTDGLKEVTKLQLGPFLGRHLCSVLDWGKRTNSPYKHLLELREVLEQLKAQKTADDFINQMLIRCENNLSFFKEKL